MTNLFKAYEGRGGYSVYYGLRHGSITGVRRPKKKETKRKVPTFAHALEMATVEELEKGIARMIKAPDAYFASPLRIEMMRARIEELKEGEVRNGK